METDLMQTVAAWTAAATGAVGIAGGAALLRRRLSRDRTEMQVDRVESEWVSRLLRERDDALDGAKEAARLRQLDAEVIARLRSQNEFLRGEVTRLKMEFSSFKRTLARIYPGTRAFVESSFAPEPPVLDLEVMPKAPKPSRPPDQDPPA